MSSVVCRVPRLVLALAAAMLPLLVAGSASAGTTVPLSAIAALPAPRPVRGAAAMLTGVTVGAPKNHYSTLTAAEDKGYCVATHDFGMRWSNTHEASAAEELDLEHLTEKDGVVTLERTRFRFDGAIGSVAALGRSQVELHEVTRNAAGVVVWAYRDGDSIVVLAKNVENGVESRTLESEEGMSPSVSPNDCPYAAARIDVRKTDAGATAQLLVAPPNAKAAKPDVQARFLIDASVSRVKRDPEPLLAVRIRAQN